MAAGTMFGFGVAAGVTGLLDVAVTSCITSTTSSSSPLSAAPGVWGFAAFFGAGVETAEEGPGVAERFFLAGITSSNSSSSGSLYLLGSLTFLEADPRGLQQTHTGS